MCVVRVSDASSIQSEDDEEKPSRREKQHTTRNWHSQEDERQLGACGGQGCVRGTV